MAQICSVDGIKSKIMQMLSMITEIASIVSQGVPTFVFALRCWIHRQSKEGFWQENTVCGSAVYFVLADGDFQQREWIFVAVKRVKKYKFGGPYQ